jgi:aldose 1-epimerase
MEVFSEKVECGLKDDIYRITLCNDRNITVQLLNLGCIIQSLKFLPDGKDTCQELILSYDQLDQYINDANFFGCIVGRYANRIKDAKFAIGSQEYLISANDRQTGNHIHGGFSGFNKKIWDFTISKSEKEVSVTFTYTSCDGEEGFPGEVQAKVAYVLNNDSQFIIRFGALTDRPTHLNLTNHSYFNFSDKNGNILNHELQIFADCYIPTDKDFIPLGIIQPFCGSGYDLRLKSRIKEFLDKIEPDQSSVCYNVCGDISCVAAKLECPDTGIGMNVYTSYPGIQLYCGDFLVNPKFNGVCLESQFFPDSPNNKRFPTTLLLPGEENVHHTIYEFYGL